MTLVRMIVVLATVALSMLAGCAQHLTMNPPQTLSVAVQKKYDYPVGLYASKELKEYTHSVRTSPLDSISYPLGEQTILLFRKNLSTVFTSVVDVDSPTPGANAMLVVQPSIVRFAPVVPFPAYNPYTATIVYKVDVFNGKGDKVYSQTATGDGQTSKGMVSGFGAKGLLADAAELAMNNAMTQILEGLAGAEELKAEEVLAGTRK